MPKRKKSTKKRAHYTVSHTVHKRSRRRRHLSAGGGAFKIASNPIAGGIIGGLAGILVKNIVSKTMAANKNADMIGTLAPIAVGFLIRKKMPYVASGMIAVPTVKFIGTKVPMLAENTMSTMEEAGNTSFVSENLLLSDALYLSDQSFSPYEMGEPLEEESVFAEYDYMNEED